MNWIRQRLIEHGGKRTVARLRSDGRAFYVASIKPMVSTYWRDTFEAWLVDEPRMAPLTEEEWNDSCEELRVSLSGEFVGGVQNLELPNKWIMEAKSCPYGKHTITRLRSDGMLYYVQSASDISPEVAEEKFSKWLNDPPDFPDRPSTKEWFVRVFGDRAQSLELVA